MGNPESKQKIINEVNQSIKTEKNKPNCDLFKRFNNYKKPYTKYKEETKLKKRNNFFNDDVKIITFGNEIINKIVTEQLKIKTNLNFILPFNLYTSISLSEMPNLEKNLKIEYEEAIKASNLYAEVSSISIKKSNSSKKRYDLYKDNDSVSSRKFNQLDNFEKNILYNLIIENENKKIIPYEDLNTTTNTKPMNNNESVNLNTTANSHKVNEVKVIKIKSKNEMLSRSNSNDKITNNDRVCKTSPINKKSMTNTKLVNKSPEKIIRLISPKMSKSPDKKTIITMMNQSVANKESPRVLLKINLKKKGNSLFEKNEQFSNSNRDQDSINKESIIKTNTENKTGCETINTINKKKLSFNMSPKAFNGFNSKQSSLSTINNENSSNSNTIKSFQEFDFIKSPPIMSNKSSYADLAKQKQSQLITDKITETFKSPLRKNDMVKKISLNNSSDNIFDVNKFKDKKIICNNRAIKENLNLSSLNNSQHEEEILNNSLNIFDKKKKEKIIFKIDLTKPDDKEENKFSEVKEKNNGIMSKLNKLKNLKNKIQKNFDKEISINNSNTERNNTDLDIIRESINHEQEETDNITRSSLQKILTPKFDILNNRNRIDAFDLNKTGNEGERFSFNVFSNNKPKEPNIRYNFDINTKIDEDDLKDIEGLDDDDDNDNDDKKIEIAKS